MTSDGRRRAARAVGPKVKARAARRLHAHSVVQLAPRAAIGVLGRVWCRGRSSLSGDDKPPKAPLGAAEDARRVRGLVPRRWRAEHRVPGGLTGAVERRGLMPLTASRISCCSVFAVHARLSPIPSENQKEVTPNSDLLLVRVTCPLPCVSPDGVAAGRCGPIPWCVALEITPKAKARAARRLWGSVTRRLRSARRPAGEVFGALGSAVAEVLVGALRVVAGHGGPAPTTPGCRTYPRG